MLEYLNMTWSSDLGDGAQQQQQGDDTSAVAAGRTVSPRLKMGSGGVVAFDRQTRAIREMMDEWQGMSPLTYISLFSSKYSLIYNG